jgi:hypothetical protein
MGLEVQFFRQTALAKRKIDDPIRGIVGDDAEPAPAQKAGGTSSDCAELRAENLASGVRNDKHGHRAVRASSA